MKTKVFQRGLLIAMTVMLCACQHIKNKKDGHFRNRAKDYYTSHIIAPLKIPEGLSQPVNSENYPIPPNLPAPGRQRVSIEPPGFGQLS